MSHLQVWEKMMTEEMMDTIHYRRPEKVLYSSHSDGHGQLSKVERLLVDKLAFSYLHHFINHEQRQILLDPALSAPEWQWRLHSKGTARLWCYLQITSLSNCYVEAIRGVLYAKKRAVIRWIDDRVQGQTVFYTAYAQKANKVGNEGFCCGR